MTAPLCPLCSAESIPSGTFVDYRKCHRCGILAPEEKWSALSALRVPPTVETPTWSEGIAAIQACFPISPPPAEDAEAAALVDKYAEELNAAGNCEAATQRCEQHGSLDPAVCEGFLVAARAALLSRLTAQPQVTVTAELCDATQKLIDAALLTLTAVSSYTQMRAGLRRAEQRELEALREGDELRAALRDAAALIAKALKQGGA